MEIVLLLGIYFVELLCYQAVMRMLFQVNVTTKKWMILGGVLPLVIGVMPVNIAGKNFLVAFVVCGIMFVSIDDTLANKGIRLVLTLLFLECIDDIFAYPSDRIFVFINKDYKGYIIYLVSKILAILIILLLNVIKEKFKKHKKTYINSIIYFVIGSIILLMLICLSIFNQAISYFPSERYIVFCDFLNIAILISIFLLLVFVIYIKNTHERMEQLLKTERLLKESQVNYYKQSLKKEADTRKYRHDMVNHLIYIQEILSQERTKDAQNYLFNILGRFKKIQSTYFVTGNDMIDIIMNYYFNMLSGDVNIIISGKCPVIIDMEDIDVCTIFSNIFQNAVEEIIENNIKDASIIIEIQKGQQYVEYIIKNSLVSEITEKTIDKNGLPKSHKLDKRNHGIGMVNLKNTVERNHGIFKWNQKNGYFVINVTLPIK